jgi:hypothetical protein
MKLVFVYFLKIKWFCVTLLGGEANHNLHVFEDVAVRFWSLGSTYY